MCYDSLLGTGGRVDRLVLYPRWRSSVGRLEVYRKYPQCVDISCVHAPRWTQTVSLIRRQENSWLLGTAKWALMQCCAQILSRDTRIGAARPNRERDSPPLVYIKRTLPSLDLDSCNLLFSFLRRLCSTLNTVSLL